MVVNWARLIFDKKVAKTVVSSVLIFFNSLGLIGVLYLGCSHFFNCSCNTHTDSKSDETDDSSPREFTFFKIELMSLYLFGLCYLFHCGLYAWKHSGNDMLAFTYNIITIVYVFFLFIFFSTLPGKNYTRTRCGKFVLLIILISNVCIWMDTFFSESNILFETYIVNNSSYIKNLTGTFSRAEDAIEKTDPFFSPAMIEFSLLAIHMLFSKNDNFISELRKPSPNEQAFLSFCQLFNFIICFTLFSFTCTVLLTYTASNDTSYPEYFIIYEVFQLVLKLLMLILIILCIFPLFHRLKFNFNVSAFVLIVSCFGNVIYHVFYFLAFFSKKGPMLKESVIISRVEDVFSVMLALLQIFFLMGIHSSETTCKPNSRDSSPRIEKMRKYLEGHVYYYCSLLGTMNLALWICDSIGELRLPVFSIELNHAYDPPVWEILNKLIFPLTIFFRFHTGLDFLKLYWQRTYRSKSKDNWMLYIS